MRLANEIVDALIVENPEVPFLCDTDTAGNILVPPEYLKSIIATKLEPVRKALEEAVWAIDCAGDEQEEGAAQSGPQSWHNEALLIGDVLAMLSKDTTETDGRQ